ncbi:phage tail tape measure protein [Runella zeae]|uniref:phage tail tape measure protein n=1 Tax=Runella zeae TaxID=94255 RepID=UPI002352FE94|nr:phage tail tape measure protein [Runella zeae]
MAKQIRKEQAVVDLVIDGRAAESSIKDIQKATFETEKLLRNMSKAANPEEYAKLKKELALLRDVQANMNAELRQSEFAWDKFKQGKSTLHEINGEIRLLEDKLSKLSRQDNIDLFDGLRQNLLDLKQAKVVIEDNLKLPSTVTSSWDKFKSSLSQIALGTVGGNVFSAIGEWIVSQVPKAIDKTYELSDAISDVKKTTGLARDEVDLLFEGFSDMKTRTIKKELQELAYQAGKLGEDTLEGVQGFVRGADIINVALKEDLGGSADEAINKLGKLISIFDLKEEFGIEQSFIKVGSVINELGGKSAASEEYIVNFTTRLAGIAPAAKISIAEVMGLAAVMDEQGQSTELAATNIGKMLVSLGSDIPYFAKIAGMSVKEFTTLLNTNANEALLKVVERAKQSEGGLGNLAKTFKTLGIDGAEGAAVIGALANNIDRVREQQAVANAEFENGTSILAEYNEKNNNTAAIMDRIGRKLSGFWTWVSKGVEPLTRFFGDLLGVVDHNAEAVSSLQAELGKIKGKEAAVEPLIKKYNDLVIQAAQGRDVNKELKTVVEQIAKVMPAAVTEVDAYGRAIDISAVKVQNMLKYQRELYEMNKKSTLTKLNQEYATISREFGDAQKDYNKGVIIDDSILGMLRRGSDGKLPKRAMTDKEREQRLKRLAEMEALQATLKGQIDALNQVETAPEKPAKTPSGTTGNVTGGGSSSADKAKKELDEFKNLKSELLKLREDLELNSLEQNQREVKAIEFKYKRLRELAKGNKDYLTQLADLEAKELSQLDAKQWEEKQVKTAENLKKSNEEYAKGVDETKQKATEIAKMRVDILKELEEGSQDDLEKILLKIDQKYDELLQRAEKAQVEADILKKIWETYWQEREKAEVDFHAKSALRENQKRQKEIEQQGKLISGVGDIFASFFEIAASNETEFAEFRRISTIAQMAADTASAISSMTSKGAFTSLTPLEAAIKITTGIAVVLANVAKAKSVLSSAPKPEQPKIQRMPGRESGGSTDLLSLYLDNNKNPQGYINRPTLFNLGERSWIGGEKFKQEYVFSNAMLQNPIFARFAAMAETLRTSGYDFTKNPDMAPGSGGASAELLPYLQILIAETQRNREAVEQFSKKPWSLRRFEDAQELLDYARNNSKA